MNRIFKSRLGILVLGLALAAFLAACGGGSSSSSSESETTAATEESTTAEESAATEESTATGSPVVVYTSVPLKTPVGDLPQIPAALEAGARAINAKGGLDGHEVVVEVCNDTDPNAEIKCVRQAAAAHAIAFIGGTFIFNAAGAVAALEKVKIPVVAWNATQAAEYSSPMYFNIDGPELAYYACPLLMPELTGKQKVAVVAQDTPLQLGTVERLEQEAKINKSIDFVGKVVVPAETTDFSSAVQQLSEKGAEIVIMQLAPPSMPGFLTAVSTLGKEFEICSSASQVPLEMLKELGPVAENVYLGSAEPPVGATDEYPLLGEFAEDIEAQAATGDENATLETGFPNLMLRAWLGTRVLEQVAESVSGELTNESLLAALNNATEVDLEGVVPTLDFSKPNPVEGYERIFNPDNTLLKWDAGKQEVVTTKAQPIDSVEALTGE